MAGVSAYRKTDLACASNEDLLLRLLEAAVQHEAKADYAMAEGRRTDWLHHIHMARAIVIELVSAFDRDAPAEVAVPILTSYRWIIHHLTEAGRTGDRERMARVQETTESLLATWTTAVRAQYDSPLTEDHP